MGRAGHGLALGLLLAGVAAAAEKPSNKTEKPETFAGAKRAPVIVAPPPPEVVAEAIRAEMDAYARRLDACTRLRQIAVDASDDKLLQTVEELERQAAAIYESRVARLGCTTKEPPKSEIRERKLRGAIDPLKVGPPTPAGRASR